VGVWDFDGSSDEPAGYWTLSGADSGYVYADRLVDLFMSPMDPALEGSVPSDCSCPPPQIELDAKVQQVTTWKWNDLSKPEYLVLDPHTPSTLYLAGRDITRSSDSGRKWVQILGGGVAASGFHGFVVGPLAPTTLYALAKGALFKSTNAGERWELLQAPIPRFTYVLAIDPWNHRVLYVGSRDGMFKSRDAGVT